MLALFIILDFITIQELQISQQGCQRSSQVMRHCRDKLRIGGSHCILSILMRQDGKSHLINPGSKFAQLIPAVNGNGISQVSASQDVQLVF